MCLIIVGKNSLISNIVRLHIIILRSMNFYSFICELNGNEIKQLSALHDKFSFVVVVEFRPQLPFDLSIYSVYSHKHTALQQCVASNYYKILRMLQA